jgi:hypothetical protein
VSETVGERVAGGAARRAGAGRGWRLPWSPTTLIIVLAALVAAALRAYQLSRPGFLLGVTEYDDGPYFGSAVRLLSGVLPYKSFVVVQPPGITLLMTPAAALAKLSGSTAAGMAAGRILTAAASVAAVVAGGLWVRHRGALAALACCGLLAVYPDAVGAAHTVLVEPWLVLFTLAGLVTVFDGDRVTTSAARLGWAGVLLGFAGAVEGWAIVPILVLAAVLAGSGTDLRAAARWRRTGRLMLGVAAGFLVPVAPFALAGPGGFYRSLITAQIGPRAHPARDPLADRMMNMAGLNDIHLRAGTVEIVAVAGLLVLALVTTAAWRAARPAPLDVYAPAAGVAVTAMFLWPAQFHYHFSAFLAPFLAAAIALPAATIAARLTAATGQPWTLAATGLAAAGLIGFTALQAGTESNYGFWANETMIASGQLDRIVPQGACVASDQSAYLLVADRFSSDVPGCSQLIDGLGTDLALSGGLKPHTGAGRVPAVASVWRGAFQHAGYLWLTFHAARRVAWTPGLRGYVAGNFVRVLRDTRGDQLYVRKGLPGA